MDIFEIPDDYKPEHPLTEAEFEEISNYLHNHPLFMKDIPADPSTNEHLVALQSLTEQQTPLEQATYLNDFGNRRMKAKPLSVPHMRDAYSKYTTALSLNCGDSDLIAKLHCNRALINLKLKNFGKVVEDCESCLKIQPNNSKAYYRLCKALLALNKLDECIKRIDSSGLNDSELIGLREEAVKTIAVKQHSKELKNELESQLQKHCSEKKYRLQRRAVPLPNGVKIELRKDNNKLNVPIVFLYPEFNQMDIIAQATEEQKISDHVECILGNQLPWDESGHYRNPADIEIYCEPSEAVLLKVPSAAKMRDILCRVPLPECLELTMVSRTSPYYEHFRSEYKFL